MRNTLSSRRILALALGTLALLSCDAAKKFIDPSGRAYDTPADTAAKRKADSVAAAQPAAKPNPAQAVAPAPTPSGPPPVQHSTWRDVPPLTAHDALVKAGDMLMTTPNGWVEFHKGRAFAKGRQLTLWDEQEVPWGLAITDLDQDGADDAILAVRSTTGTDTNWTLAVLLDRGGKLQCIQAVNLRHVDGIQSLEATQGGVLVSPRTGSPLLYGWVGGELVGN